MDHKMAARYQNGFHAVIRLYNQMVKVLDDMLPKGLFFNRREAFKMISETEIHNLEQRAIDDVIRDVERNFHGNFKDYIDDPYERAALRLEDIPTVRLPWNKDN